ncbi:MAG: bifunctional ADP-dependent NAD(P)H-hydrate dehydratase/NAD(P)H-hydrate epimerase, partial [Candidatus Adiutrix sp.]|nr:bifunctional ADP-dependent NAD(P)H-hydrate dehydratase/NAD(P)H-hydrate epimerase [Candidatus Adiutrix sp.]
MYLVTNEEMRRLDSLAIDHFGLPGIVLMENAAQAVARAALEHWPLRPDDIVFVLAGPGRNGGDGWALARIFSGRGLTVRGFLVKAPGRAVGGDAAIN